MVLLVDDESIVLQAAGRALEQHGFTVLRAFSGNEAIGMFSAMSYLIAVVVLDVTMPGISSEDTFHQLRQISPGVRVILSSGYSESEIRSRFGDIGAADFLSKPDTAHQLVDKLTRVCAAE